MVNRISTVESLVWAEKTIRAKGGESGSWCFEGGSTIAAQEQVVSGFGRHHHKQQAAKTLLALQMMPGVYPSDADEVSWDLDEIDQNVVKNIIHGPRVYKIL